VSRGGAPSERARRIIAGGQGIVICPRLEDWLPRQDKAPAGGEYEAPCAVCDHPVVASAASRPLEQDGFSLVCTYDAERFRDVLNHEVVTEAVEAAREETRERFARRHGGRPEDVVQTLPPELSWLSERGVT
jgi:hypothetical protein